MLEVKTITNRLINAPIFDDAVNAALAEGWKLTRREVLHPGQESVYFALYAELEREVIPWGERCCDNCIHRDLEGGEPCGSCDPKANNKWEPPKGVVTR